METEFGKFLQFESLTLCPIDKTPINIEMMTIEEIQWLNDYHQMVFDRLSPYLSDEEVAWLKEATEPLKK
jgi:Xaa-Pro aminopeptidase